MKNMLMLNIPILELSVINVTKPTIIGPNKAANLPNMLYIPKYSECFSLGINLAKYDLLKA